MTWLISLAAPTFAVLVSYLLTRRKIAEIHVLVNSRLTDALREIIGLKDELGVPVLPQQRKEVGLPPAPTTED